MWPCRIVTPRNPPPLGLGSRQQFPTICLAAFMSRGNYRRRPKRNTGRRYDSTQNLRQPIATWGTCFFGSISWSRRRKSSSWPSSSIPRGSFCSGLLAKWLGLHPQCFPISVVYTTILQADAFQQLGENTVERLLVRPRLQPILHVSDVALKLHELYDFSPIGRWNYADDCRRLFHLLVRPESPADVIFFERLHKLRDPLVGVLSGLAHPDRHIKVFAKIDVFPQHTLIRRRPIFVKRVRDIGIERLTENRKVAVPLRTAEKEDVVSIDFADLRRHLLVERFEERIQRFELGIVWNRLVQQVIA